MRTAFADPLPMVKKLSTMPKPAERPKYRRTYIGEWIEHLKLTQTAVAAKARISESHLSLMISGNRPYVQKKLEAVADVLGVERGRLFHPPTETPDWLSLEGLSETERIAALNVVNGFRPKK